MVERGEVQTIDWGDAGIPGALQEAMTTDFPSLERSEAVISAYDLFGRAVIIFTPKLGYDILEPGFRMRKLTLYALRRLAEVADRPYCVVYCNTNMPLMSSATYSIFSTMWQSLPKPFRKNIRELHVVHPNLTVKAFFEFSKLFLSPRFFRKLRYVDTLAALARPPFDHLKHLPIPAFVIAQEPRQAARSMHPLYNRDTFGNACLGVPLPVTFDPGRGCPAFMADIIDYLTAYALTTEGLFRLSGDQETLETAKQKLRVGAPVGLMPPPGADAHATITVDMAAATAEGNTVNAGAGDRWDEKAGEGADEKGEGVNVSAAMAVVAAPIGSPGSHSEFYSGDEEEGEFIGDADGGGDDNGSEDSEYYSLEEDEEGQQSGGAHAATGNQASTAGAAAGRPQAGAHRKQDSRRRTGRKTRKKGGPQSSTTTSVSASARPTRPTKNRRVPLGAATDADSDMYPVNDVHVAAQVLKAFVRELPEPLITFKTYDVCMAVLVEELGEAVSGTSMATLVSDAKTITVPIEVARKLKQAVDRMPAEHRVTLYTLFRFLRAVTTNAEENRMTNENMAIVWAPNVFKAPAPQTVSQPNPSEATPSTDLMTRPGDNPVDMLRETALSQLATRALLDYWNEVFDNGFGR